MPLEMVDTILAFQIRSGQLAVMRTSHQIHRRCKLLLPDHGVLRLRIVSNLNFNFYLAHPRSLSTQLAATAHHIVLEITCLNRLGDLVAGSSGVVQSLIAVEPRRKTCLIRLRAFEPIPLTFRQEMVISIFGSFTSFETLAFEISDDIKIDDVREERKCIVETMKSALEPTLGPLERKVGSHQRSHVLVFHPWEHLKHLKEISDRER